jgi:hypothetical protein
MVEPVKSASGCLVGRSSGCVRKVGDVRPSVISSTEFWFADSRVRPCEQPVAHSRTRPCSEIVPIDIESDVHVLRVQIRTGRVVKAPNLATGQDLERPMASGSPSLPLEPIAKVDGTEFVFVGSLQAIIVHRDK